MAQDNIMVLADEERSRSSGNEGVFDFKNLRNCLPTTNHQSGRISVCFQDIERSKWRLRKMRTWLQWKKNLATKSQDKTLLEKTSVSQGSANLGDSSTSHERKENTLAGKQENVSSLHISNRGLCEPLKYFEQQRAEYRRNLLRIRETDRLKRACSSRSLFVEDMDESERMSQQRELLCLSVQSKILEEKKRILEAIAESARLIQVMKAQEKLLRTP